MTTNIPQQLINSVGSAAGQVLTSTGPGAPPAWTSVTTVPQPTRETFVAGTNFTPGSTTSLTLAGTYGSIANVLVFFDTNAQFDCSLTGKVLSFNPVVPVGVQQVTVVANTPLNIGTPSPGTVTDSSVASVSKLANRIATINVKDPAFGAKGDGATDDRPAILAAIAYANSIGGGQVYFPPGIYGAMASIVSVNINNVQCIGAGIGSTSIKALSAGTFTNGLLTFSGGSAVKCSGISFNVNNKSVGALTPAVYFGTMTDIEVSDCEVTHMSIIGIGASACARVRIYRNKVTLDVPFGNQNDGILVSGTLNDIWICDNEVNNTGIVANGSNVWMTGNVCRNTQYGAGVTTGSQGPFYVLNNVCSGGFGFDQDGTYVAGIEFSGLGGICAGNICYSNYGVGIASFSFGGVIANNICYNNCTAGAVTHQAGIVGSYASTSSFFARNTVVGNTCYDTGGGTQLYGYSDDTNQCVNNTFSGNNFEFNATAPVKMLSQNSYDGGMYEGILAYAGGTVASNTSSTFNVTVQSAKVGDFAIGSLDSYGGAGSATISAYCIGPNTVSVTVANVTASTITLPAGNFRAKVLRHYM